MTLVSDSCIAHVSLKLKTENVRAAHEGEIHRLSERGAVCKTLAQSMKYFERAEIESEKVKVAQEEIFKLAQIGLRTLLCMSGLPEMTPPDSKLELRLLLCRVDSIGDSP